MITHRHQHQIDHNKPDSTLHVIGVCSNPVRFNSRYALFQEFKKKMVATPGIAMTTVELALGARDFAVTGDHVRDIQVRAQSELWHKENLINIGFQALPDNWQYAAWIDGDVDFYNENWVHDTLNALQHHRVVQMWKDCIDKGPSGGVENLHRSFGYQYVNGAPMGILAGEAGGYGNGKKIFPHPGFAWAIRRDAHDGIGQLVDYAILGAGDHHMAWAFIGGVETSVPTVGIHPAYLKRLQAFQARCETYVRRDLGYVHGTIGHNWHGKKRDRKYVERWSILKNSKYDPDVDLKYNHSGVLELSGHNLKLRDGIRTYFRVRNEDSVDTE